MFKTRFTEILGVEYPIQCGTMMHISNAEFTAVNANAGVFACLASAMSPNEQALVGEIRKLKDLSDRPFGVNVSLFPGLLPIPVEKTIDIVAKEGRGIIETAGHSPAPYREQIRASGLTHVHKCARLKDAMKAEALGVDIIAVVGSECGGHPSREDVTSLVLIPSVAEHTSIPLIADGGFCDGKTLVAALALGADAMLSGTRFMSTVECRLHDSYKEVLIQAKETHTVLTQRSIGSLSRVLRNSWAEKILEMEDKGATLEELMPYIRGKRGARAWINGDEDATLACGQAVGRTRETLSIRELVSGIMAEAEETRKRIVDL